MRPELQTLLNTPGLRKAEELLGTEQEGNLADWLKPGGIHEWFLTAGENISPGIWYPPLILMTGFAANFRREVLPKGRTKLVFIGRLCWPAFQLLASYAEALALLQNSLFLDPQSPNERFFAIAEALRCPAVAAVIGDASTMNVTQARRVQLAAEQSGALSFLGRPPWEIHEPSWARTRWQISSLPADLNQLKWNVQLFCKGWPQNVPRKWMAEYEVCRGTSTLRLSAPVGYRASAAPARTASG